jgi:hypothetical protein
MKWLTFSCTWLSTVARTVSSIDLTSLNMISNNEHSLQWPACLCGTAHSSLTSAHKSVWQVFSASGTSLTRSTLTTDLQSNKLYPITFHYCNINTAPWNSKQNTNLYARSNFHFQIISFSMDKLFHRFLKSNLFCNNKYVTLCTNKPLKGTITKLNTNQKTSNDNRVFRCGEHNQKNIIQLAVIICDWYSILKQKLYVIHAHYWK